MAYNHDFIQDCPVCGEKIPYEAYYEEPVGLVEFHVNCPNCGYFAEMCYSPVYEGICEGFDLQYKDRVEELGLDIVPEEFVP